MDLPDDLQLPLTSGAAWWYWLGGRPAIDFVNTHRERWWRNVETLVTPDDLTQWLLQAQLLEQPAVVSENQLSAARELRQSIDDGIQASIAHQPTSPETIAVLNRWLAELSDRPQLHVDQADRVILGLAAPADLAQQAIASLAHDAAMLIGTAQSDRLRVCASTTCSARFYDASRAGTRRWCSMNACGNVAKARRHRAKHQPGPVPPSS